MTARLFIFICNHKGPDRLGRIRYICGVFVLGPFFYVKPRANKVQFRVTKELSGGTWLSDATPDLKCDFNGLK